MRTTSNVHVIPVDEGDDSSSLATQPQTSSFNGESCNDFNSSKHDRENPLIGQTLSDVRYAGFLMHKATSAAIRREAIALNKRLTAYHMRLHKRRNQQHLQKKVGISSRPALSIRRNEFTRDEGSSKCHSSNQRVRQPLSNEASIEVSTMDDAVDVSLSQEYSSICEQANRMERMTILLHSLEGNQRRLLQEFYAYKVDADREMAPSCERLGES